MAVAPEYSTKKTEFYLGALHIYVLSSFALAQPLYSGLAAKTVYLVDQDIRLATVLLVVVLLSLVAPTGLVLLELATGCVSASARRRLHLCCVFLLLAATILPVLSKLLGLMCYVTIGMTLVLTALGVAGYFRFRSVQLFVTVACPSVVLFPGVLLFASAATKVLLPDPPPEAPPLAVENPVPVVMVVFDGLNGASIRSAEDQVDASRFPAFAELARHSTWFKNATTVHVSTDNAVPAILSGSYPAPGSQAVVNHHPNNLFTLLLSTKKYEFVVFEPFTRLFPQESDAKSAAAVGTVDQARSVLETLSIVYLRHVIPTDFPAELPSIPKIWYGLPNDPVSELLDKRRGLVRHHWESLRHVQCEHFLECIADRNEPVLYFFHVVLPHVPLQYLPSAAQYSTRYGGSVYLPGSIGVDAQLWSSDELAAVQGFQRYLLQVGFVDRYLSRLMERLQETGMYDRCLLVVTSDHGICFRAGQPRRKLSDENLADILPVPLFVKRPNQRHAEISDRQVESIDILPTIADMLGIQLPWKTDGWSMFDRTRPGRKVKRLFNDDGLTILDGSYPAASKSLAHMLRNFQSNAGLGALFQIGPHAELIGRPVSALRLLGQSSLPMKLYGFAKHYDPDPEALVPCFLEGEFLTPVPEGQPVNVAIAVNGTIRGVTRTYELQNLRSTWTAMVPESAFRPGENDVQIFVVLEDSGHVALQLCTPVRAGK